MALPTSSDPKKDQDNAELMRLGKLPVLKRNFGLMSMLAFSCTVMITWEAVLLLPTSGGQYHWVYVLGPPSMKKLLSFLVGWLTVTGWLAVVASGGFICAHLIEGLAILGNPEYSPQPYQATLIIWAVVVFAVIVNTLVSRALPGIESLIMILHIMGFFGILVPLIYLSDHGDASEVFTTFYNEGGWPSQGVSFLVGLIGPVFAFGGADGAVHMSEEIKKASTAVPQAMILSIIINGSMGFAMLLSILFCIGDPEVVLAAPTPFLAIFEQGVGSKNGALAMGAVVTVLAVSATISWLASASRMVWSFARDRGVPGWRLLSKVDSKTTIPVISIALTTLIACLLGLINLGSSVAFNDVVSLSVNGLYISYLVGNSLLLWRRLSTKILDREEYEWDNRRTSRIKDGTAVIPSDERLVWGPWRIPEPLGTINNVFGCAFLVVILLFSIFPPNVNPSPSEMNYAVVMVVGVVTFAMVYYLLWARKVYEGPVIETVVASP